VIEAIRQNPGVYEYAKLEMQRDPDIIRATEESWQAHRDRLDSAEGHLRHEG